MKINKKPDHYPHKYFPSSNNRTNFVQFIRFAVTPTGKIGIDFEQIRIYFRPNGKFAAMSNKAIIEYADRNTKIDRLRKGYKWGELFVDCDFSERNFIK